MSGYLPDGVTQDDIDAALMEEPEPREEDEYDEEELFVLAQHPQLRHYPRLLDAIVSGDAWVTEILSVQGKKKDGSRVDLGDLDDPEDVETFLGLYPTPDLW